MERKQLTVGKLIEILKLCNPDIPIAVLANNHWTDEPSRVSVVRTPSETHIMIGNQSDYNNRGNLNIDANLFNKYEQTHSNTIQ